jgi:lactate dehydrogenase-like 2-hydroxyacid dehydrogenase
VSAPPRAAEVLLLTELPPNTVSDLAEHFAITRLPAQTDPQRFLARDGGRFRAVCTHSLFGADRALLAQLPQVELIACFGVGVDRIDLDAARERGVRVTNTPDVLTDDVADLAIGLLLSAARRIAQGDRFVRAGQWTTSQLALGSTLRNKRLGIAGLGRIGAAVALRAAAFGMDIRYFSRAAKPGVSYSYRPTLLELAADSDFLVLCIAGGPETHYLVDARVLAALGPAGILVNIARGSLVDESALIRALQRGELHSAALDVFQNEPHIRAEFCALDNVTLLPHMGSATEATRTAMGRLMIENLVAFFAGKPLVTPVLAALP